MNMRAIPKIELHCHLDGSMRVETIQSLLAAEGEKVGIEELKEQLVAPMDCQSLAEYLEKFDLPIRCLQTREALRMAAYDLACQAAEEQVRYLEVRFAPSFHTGRGLSISQIIESVWEGLKQAGADCGIYTGILVCGMRNLSMEENLDMLKEAREFYGNGVVGCDLAGDEKRYPTGNFWDFFQLAKKLKMPYTIHSGECQSADNVRAAIELGARRLGHGIAMAQNPELIRVCVNKGIGVELCPTSNLQTKAVDTIQNYPFLRFQKSGIAISINTDNRTVSDTTCTKELELLYDHFGLTDEMLRKIYRDSVEMSFAADEIKHELLRVVWNPGNP